MASAREAEAAAAPDSVIDKLRRTLTAAAAPPDAVAGFAKYEIGQLAAKLLDRLRSELATSGLALRQTALTPEGECHILIGNHPVIFDLSFLRWSMEQVEYEAVLQWIKERSALSDRPPRFLLCATHNDLQAQLPWSDLAKRAAGFQAVLVSPAQLWAFLHAGKKVEPLRPHMQADRAITRAEDDRLQFKDYAAAIAHLIDNPNTETPLTIAINAPWGAGKSSLGHLIRERLQRKPAAGGAAPHMTFWFEAWMHDEAKDLASAFVAELSRHCDRLRPWWLRWLHPLPLSFQSRGERVLSQALRLSVAVLLAVAVVWYFGQPAFVASALRDLGATAENLKAPAAGITTTLLTVLFSVLRRVMETGKKIGDFVSDPQAEASRGSLKQVRDQLVRLVEQATPDGSRLVIFIDDLERCRPPGGIDLLEAINQLLARAPVVVVALCDLGAVAAAAEIKYKALAERYAPAGTMRDPDAFGRMYLQKLVQMQFDLPEQPAGVVHDFMRAVVGDEVNRVRPPNEDDSRPLAPSSRAIDAVKGALPLAMAWRPYADTRAFLNAWYRATRPMGRQGSWAMGAVGVFLLPYFWGARMGTGLFYRHNERVEGVSTPPPPQSFYFAMLMAVPVFWLLLVYLSRGNIPALGFNVATTVFVIGLATAWACISYVAQAIVAATLAFSYRRRDREALEYQRAHARDVGTPQNQTTIRAEFIEEHEVLRLTNESDEFERARLQALRHLRPQPRSVKRLVNRIRLLLSVLARRELFDPNTELTPEQVGKWVALQELWPDFANHVVARPRRLAAVEALVSRMREADHDPAAFAQAKKDFDAAVARLAPHFTSLDELALFLESKPALGTVTVVLAHMRAEPRAAASATPPPSGWERPPLPAPWSGA